MSARETVPDRQAEQTEIAPFDAQAIAAVERAVLRRRSVRGFSSRPVAESLRQRIFALAQSTPSSSEPANRTRTTRAPLADNVNFRE